MSIVKIAMIGDLFGRTGCALFARHSASLKKEHDLDAIIVNGENTADGKGITHKIGAFLTQHGAAVVTTGNHVWAKKEVIPHFNEQEVIVRPANYPDTCPGKGMTFFMCKGVTVCVINLMGRVFMPSTLDCPLKKAEALLVDARKITPIILIDMHAETSHEKLTLAYALDGKVTAVVGTHTHVQTADARMLPLGTGYMSDLGMAGSLNSMIGAQKEGLLQKFLTQMPTKHEEAIDAPYVLSGAIITIDGSTGKALALEPFRIIDHEPLSMKERKW